jgi:hypothetical protein
MKKTSKAVKASRERAGVMPTSLGLTEVQKINLDAFARELGMSRVAAIFEAIESYRGQGTITKERLIAEITRRLK